MSLGDRRRPLLLLSVCVFFVICTEILPVGLLPQIGRGLGVSTASAGVLVSLYAVVVAVLSVPIAAVVQRWPRRTVIAALLGAYAASNVIFAVAPSYPVAIVARVLGGAAHAGFFAVAVAAAVSLVDRAHAGRAVATVMIGNALSLVIGIPAGTALGAALGWRWSFAALAAVFVGLALAVVRVLPAQTSARAAGQTSVLAGLTRPAVLAMTVVITLLALGHFTLFTYVSPWLTGRGVAPTAVSLVLLAYGGGGLLGLSAASLVVSHHPEAALAVDIVIMGTSLALAAAVDAPTGAVVIAIVWGVSFGAFPTLTQTVMLRAAGDATDAASALVNATTNVGIAGGAFLGSRLLGVVGAAQLGWVGAGLVAASLLVFLTRRRRTG